MKEKQDNHPTLTPPNEWVSVEERLPEDEARQYIDAAVVFQTGEHNNCPFWENYDEEMWGDGAE